MADDILKNIPLPVDLPENWTSGQIIAPTGAEAGLDDQHGYNYLMKQVNNAQKALKALAAQREEDIAKIKFWVSPDSTSPAEFFGGTWERIEGKFIMGASDAYPAGSTGGSATHTQTVREIASHYHDRITSRQYNQKLVGQADSPSGEAGYIKAQYTTGSPEAFNFAYMATSDAGGGQPMDILNPYYSMYIWRRVA